MNGDDDVLLRPLLLWWWPEMLVIHYTYVRADEDPLADDFYPRTTYFASGWEAAPPPATALT